MIYQLFIFEYLLYLVVAPAPGPATTTPAAASCGTSLPPTVDYALRTPYQGGQGGQVVSYFCPAHMVFDTTLKLNGVSSTCNGEWSAVTANCVAATCIPKCKNGGTCTCGRLYCECKCSGSWLGVDCSVDGTQLPLSNIALFLYNSDPHWIARPEIDNLPWSFSLVGSYHGQIKNYVALTSATHFGKQYFGFIMDSTLSNGEVSASNRGYIYIPGPTQTLAIDVGSKYNYFLYWDPFVTTTVNYYVQMALVSYPQSSVANQLLWSSTTLRLSYKSLKSGGSAPFATTNYDWPGDIIADHGLLNWFYKIESTNSIQFVLRSVRDIPTITSNTSSLSSYFQSPSDGLNIGFDANEGIENIRGMVGPFLIMKDINTGCPNENLTALNAFLTTSHSQDIGSAISMNTCIIPPFSNNAIPIMPTTFQQNGGSLTFKCGPGKMFQVYSIGSVSYYWPTYKITCQSGTWSALPDCVSVDADFLPRCEPVCANGGTCDCSSSTCVCSCSSGYTGPDCSLSMDLITNLGSSLLAFWPLNDHFIRSVMSGTQIDSLLAMDMSGNGYDLSIGAGVAISTSSPFPSSAAVSFELTGKRVESFFYTDEPELTWAVGSSSHTGTHQIAGYFKVRTYVTGLPHSLVVWKKNGTLEGTRINVTPGQKYAYKGDAVYQFDDSVVKADQGQWKSLNIEATKDGGDVAVSASHFGQTATSLTSGSSITSDNLGLYIGYYDNFGTSGTSGGADANIACVFLRKNGPGGNEADMSKLCNQAFKTSMTTFEFFPFYCLYFLTRMFITPGCWS